MLFLVIVRIQREDGITGFVDELLHFLVREWFLLTHFRLVDKNETLQLISAVKVQYFTGLR